MKTNRPFILIGTAIIILLGALGALAAFVYSRVDEGLNDSSVETLVAVYGTQAEAANQATETEIAAYTATPTATETPSVTPSITPSRTPSPTETPSATPTETITPSPTDTPSLTPSRTLRPRDAAEATLTAEADDPVRAEITEIVQEIEATSNANATETATLWTSTPTPTYTPSPTVSRQQLPTQGARDEATLRFEGEDASVARLSYESEALGIRFDYPSAATVEEDSVSIVVTSLFSADAIVFILRDSPSGLLRGDVFPTISSPEAALEGILQQELDLSNPAIILNDSFGFPTYQFIDQDNGGFLGAFLVEVDSDDWVYIVAVIPFDDSVDYLSEFTYIILNSIEIRSSSDF